LTTNKSNDDSGGFGMKVKEIMNRNVISVDQEETVSKALGKMSNHRVHQLVVFDKNRYVGMLELKSIVTKNIDPSYAKTRNYVKKVPELSPEDDMTNAVEILVQSGLRALPVVDKGNVVGVLAETDAMKFAKDRISNDLTVKQVMSQCVYVDRETKTSKVQNLMFETNVSRIPVLDGDMVVGVVGTLDLIKVLNAKTEPAPRDEKSAKEKQRTTDIPAEAIMSAPTVVSLETKLAEAIPYLQANEELIVKNGDIGIITPKDVLTVITRKEQKGIPVQLIGLGNEGIEFRAKMDLLLQKTTDKFSKMFDGIEYIIVHTENMQKQGPKKKYSVRVRIKTPFGHFVSHAWGWKPVDVLQDAFDNIERELMKKYEKLRSHEKAQKGKAKGRI
jgi:CBS domain-containing protein/ribosome-associated translation inhibitor RaiA